MSSHRYHTWAEQCEHDEPPAGCFEVFETTTGCDAHFQQEQTEHSVEDIHKQGVIQAGDCFALQASEKADDNPTEQEVESRVQEDFVQKFLAENRFFLFFDFHIQLGSQFATGCRFRGDGGLSVSCSC